MTRIPRSFLPRSGIFHVICRSNNYQIIFHDDEDYSVFKSKVNYYQKEWEIVILHYCFMPTHCHFQIQVQDIRNLSKAIQAIQISYFYYYNSKYSHRGHLWLSRYRSIPIEDDTYLYGCARYIELNPHAAGLVKLPATYKWSSCKCYVSSEEDDLITLSDWYIELSENISERQLLYKKYIHEGMKSEIDEEKIFEKVSFIGDVSLVNERQSYIYGRKDRKTSS